MSAACSWMSGRWFRVGVRWESPREDIDEPMDRPCLKGWSWMAKKRTVALFEVMHASQANQQPLVKRKPWYTRLAGGSSSLPAPKSRPKSTVKESRAAGGVIAAGHAAILPGAGASDQSQPSAGGAAKQYAFESVSFSELLGESLFNRSLPSRRGPFRRVRRLRSAACMRSPPTWKRASAAKQPKPAGQ
jgi:hypothetical protein